MQNFDKFCYIFVIVMVLLDRGTTLYYFQVLNMDTDLERNLIARFILEQELWSYYITTTIQQICVFIVLIGMFRIMANRIARNYIMLIPLIYSAYPVINNLIVLME